MQLNFLEKENKNQEKKRGEELPLSQCICRSRRDPSGECGFAFLGCFVGLPTDPV